MFEPLQLTLVDVANWVLSHCLQIYAWSRWRERRGSRYFESAIDPSFTSALRLAINTCYHFAINAHFEISSWVAKIDIGT